MSREFPDWIDPWKAADGKRIFAGTVPIAGMQRLAPLLANEEAASGQLGEVAFKIAFDHDFERRPRIRLSVEAELPLTCQRTLRVFHERVRRSAVLSVIRTLSEQDSLPADCEAVLVEGDSTSLSLVEVVEDELLLALPAVPRSPDSEPVELEFDAGERQGAEDLDHAGLDHSADRHGARQDELGPTRRPFADLARLMKHDETID